jgi:hypothetical protein
MLKLEIEVLFWLGFSGSAQLKLESRNKEEIFFFWFGLRVAESQRVSFFSFF